MNALTSGFLRLLLALGAASSLACGDPSEANEDNIKQALDTMLAAKRPNCVVLGRPMQAFPGDFEVNRRTGTSLEVDRFKPLIDKGLLTLTPVQMKPDDTGRSKAVDGVHIDVSDAGRPYFADDIVARYLFGSGAYGGLCVGEAYVDSVLNFTVPSEVASTQIVQVKYAYRVRSLPDWARDEAIQASFPQLKAIVAAAEQPVQQQAVLTLSNNGWTHEL